MQTVPSIQLGSNNLIFTMSLSSKVFPRPVGVQAAT